MEVKCSIPERTGLSVVVLIMESADRTLMPTSVAVRAGIWLRIAHRTGVSVEVMLILGLIHRVQELPSLLRGTGFYALKGREEQEKSADVVKRMLQVFSTSVYA